jgi:hypothetical protein
MPIRVNAGEATEAISATLPLGTVSFEHHPADDGWSGSSQTPLRLWSRARKAGKDGTSL